VYTDADDDGNDDGEEVTRVSEEFLNEHGGMITIEA
jgi:hypothetical protein